MTQSYDYVIAGAGFSGSVLAQQLAERAEARILLIEKSQHSGGLCSDRMDENGILVQSCGPHILHTSSERVWGYLSRFTTWHDYRHRVLACLEGEYYPIPINLDTINSFFGLKLAEDSVEDFLETRREKVAAIKSSREVVTSKYGLELYDAFVHNFTKKQWDLYPSQLEPGVLERLPVRFDRNPYYFTDRHEAIPASGYSSLFRSLLAAEGIELVLGSDYRQILPEVEYGDLVLTSPIDEYFDHKLGRLRYRSLRFEFEHLRQDRCQPVAVVNFPGEEPYTRVTEFKQLSGQDHAGTTICREYPTWEGEPCYAVPEPGQLELYARYAGLASRQPEGIYFLGRLGQYHNIDMDEAVLAALRLADHLVEKNQCS